MKIRLYMGESDVKHVTQVFTGGVPGKILDLLTTSDMYSTCREG